VKGLGALLTVTIAAVTIMVGSTAPLAQPAAAALAPLSDPSLTPLNVTIDEGPIGANIKPDVRSMTFDSPALERSMPYSIYLPPGYSTSTRRYPVLYMLHGMSGTNDEWRAYGLFDRADHMIRAGELRPMIIVLPQGDKAYWVDHALPTDRQAWGRYMARDVVANVDAHFRTRADAPHRAIGGVSMGAHGAMQLALNYPGTFSVVGAHSLVLRRYDTAPGYFGSQTDWAQRDPMQLVRSKVDMMRSLDVWIDIGAADPWSKLAEQFNGELTSLGIKHKWHEWNGDHSASYWCEHLAEYLRFYDASLAAREPVAGLAAHLL
jgi:enterochelin esterase-like enzyme